MATLILEPIPPLARIIAKVEADVAEYRMLAKIYEPACALGDYEQAAVAGEAYVKRYRRAALEGVVKR